MGKAELKIVRMCAKLDLKVLSVSMEAARGYNWEGEGERWVNEEREKKKKG